MGKKDKRNPQLPSAPADTEPLYDYKADKVFRQYANRQLPFSTARTNSTLESYAGPWTRTEIIHLLRRTTFGLKNSDVKYAACPHAGPGGRFIN